jgi:hypothetical protein
VSRRQSDNHRLPERELILEIQNNLTEDRKKTEENERNNSEIAIPRATIAEGTDKPLAGTDKIATSRDRST